jgi:hypothetical protein
VEEHPATLADRLVAAEFAVKFQNDLSVKRRTKLYGHAISPKLPTRRCTAARYLLKMPGAVMHKRNRRQSSYNVVDQALDCAWSNRVLKHLFHLTTMRGHAHCDADHGDSERNGDRENEFREVLRKGH